MQPKEPETATKKFLQAKFDKMVVPIARLVIDPEQQKHIRFDAFLKIRCFMK